MRRVRVKTGRLTGANLGETHLSDVLFEDCRADLATFAAAQIERVRFESCGLRAADFQRTRFKLVVFENCDLREVDLSGARFDKVELRGCRLDGARGLTELRGVRMPWPDVLANAASEFIAHEGLAARI